MKFLKRIVYGVVVGTCLIFINHKCVKAADYNIYNNSDFSGWIQNSGSPSSNSYDYGFFSNTFFHACLSGDDNCEQQDDVGYKIFPTLDTVSPLTFNGWNNTRDNTFSFGNNRTINLSFQKSSGNKYSLFNSYYFINSSYQNPTNYLRVDYNKFDFTVNNYLRFNYKFSTDVISYYIFSSGDLPIYNYVDDYRYTDRFEFSSDAVIAGVWYRTNGSNYNNFYYFFRRVHAGDKVQGYIIGRWKDANNIYDYLTTQDINFYTSSTDYVTLQNNVPPEDIFTVDWVKIDSTDDSDELFGNDNTVTSTNIGARFSPVDFTKYDYYLGFTASDSCSDNLEDYTKMTSSDKGVLTIANIKENGLVCAKITKANTTNVVFTDTYTIDTIGKLSTFGFSNNKFSVFIDNLVNRLNYGGPISSLISIPLGLLSAIINAFNSSCSSYNLGSLLGHNIVFPCFNIQSILGSTITNVIDLLGSFTIYYHLILFIISIYRKIMNLDDLDDYIPKHIYQPKHGSY